MRFDVIAMLVAFANVLGAGMIVPQVLKIQRSRDFGGVSGVWVGVGIGMNLWWVAYALQAHLWGLVPVSVAAIVLYSIIGVQFSEMVGAEGRRSLALGAFGLGSVPLPFLLFSGWSAAGLVIGLCYGLQFAPAVLTALRSDKLGGISSVTWSMALAEAVIWFVYGTSEGEQALMVGGGGGALMALIILVRLYSTTRTQTLEHNPWTEERISERPQPVPVVAPH